MRARTDTTGSGIVSRGRPLIVSGQVRGILSSPVLARSCLLCNAPVNERVNLGSCKLVIGELVSHGRCLERLGTWEAGSPAVQCACCHHPPGTPLLALRKKPTYCFRLLYTPGWHTSSRTKDQCDGGGSTPQQRLFGFLPSLAVHLHLWLCIRPRTTVT